MRTFLLILFSINITCNATFVQSKDFNELLGLADELTLHLIKPQRLDAELAKDSTIVILDTREKKEYEISHIKNARNVGYNDFAIESIKDIPKNTRIIVYCSVGYRSEKIGEKLLKEGYTNVSNLSGGIFEWVNEDYPVYDNDNKKTNKIHAYSIIWGIWLKKGEKVYE